MNKIRTKYFTFLSYITGAHNWNKLTIFQRIFHYLYLNSGKRRKWPIEHPTIRGIWNK